MTDRTKSSPTAAQRGRSATGQRCYALSPKQVFFEHVKGSMLVVSIWGEN